MKRYHWKSKKFNIKNFDLEDVETRKNNTIVIDCYGESGIQYTDKVNNKSCLDIVHQINDKQNVEEVPGTINQKNNAKNEMLPEVFAEINCANSVEEMYDKEQNFEKIEFLEEMENDIESMQVDTHEFLLEKYVKQSLPVDPITAFISENDDDLKIQKTKKGGSVRKKIITKFHCSICVKNLGSEAKLRNHNIMNHTETGILISSNKNFLCKICNRSFATEESQINHFASFCSKLKRTEKILESSINTIGDENNKKVNDESTQNLEGTVFAESIGLNPRICKFCHKQFKSSYYRSAHELVHTGEKPFSCEICNKTFRLKTQLDNHTKTHKGVKPFKCEICEASFTLHTNLSVHMRRHPGQMRYKCDYCDKHFVTSSEKNSHSRMHTGEKPYKCNFCKEEFKYSNKFLQHIQMAHSNEIFKCEQCEKIFKTKYKLKIHTLTHSKERPFKCNECQAKFTSKTNLAKHTNIHSDIGRYLCSKCGQNFNHRTGLNTYEKKT